MIGLTQVNTTMYALETIKSIWFLSLGGAGRP